MKKNQIHVQIENAINCTSWIVTSLPLLCETCVNKEAIWLLVSLSFRSDLVASRSELRSSLDHQGLTPSTYEFLIASECCLVSNAQEKVSY